MVAVFYDEKMVADSLGFSPSAKKPGQVVQDWQQHGLPVEIHGVNPITRGMLYSVHSLYYVDGVLDLLIENGHGNKCPKIAESLLYTNGSFLQASRYALQHGVACSPTSGFHHAGYKDGGGFCTFNGLMLAAQFLLWEDCETVAILDADAHYGDGTADIIKKLGLEKDIIHWTFGQSCTGYSDMMDDLALIHNVFQDEAPDIILYQAGADPHEDDPLGGYLTSDEMRYRDRFVFEMCSRLKIPVVWNLAGGYQQNRDGGIPAVLDLHRATMEECVAAYSTVVSPSA